MEVKCNGGMIKPCLISAQSAAAFSLTDSIAKEIDQTKQSAGQRIVRWKEKGIHTQKATLLLTA